MNEQAYSAIVIGASAGGMEALIALLSGLPEGFGLYLLVVQHLHPSDRGRLARQLDNTLELSVSEACDKEELRTGQVYFAPANYHLLVEQNETLALSVDERVNWSRPSIDVLFDSAARVWGHRLVGVILTGANSDGAAGLRCIAEHGGLTVVQDPDSARSAEMPRAAIEAVTVDRILPLEKIGSFLRSLDPGCCERKELAEKNNGECKP
ncbi:MAG: chemotaxis protein CheB [Sedimenticola sp.]